MLAASARPGGGLTVRLHRSLEVTGTVLAAFGREAVVERQAFVTEEAGDA